MNLSRPFIERPVATTLLTAGLVLAGIAAFVHLPVAPLPQVDFPTIDVQASLPGASPETMAATVAAPLERSLGRIAAVSEMTSSSSLGSTHITLQFDLSRDIDGAARDVQAAINASRALLPTGLPGNPVYHKVNPADAPIMILGLTSNALTRGQMYDSASTVLAQKLLQVEGIGDVQAGGSSLPAVRVELNLPAMNGLGLSPETVRAAIAATNANRPKGALESGELRWQIAANDQAMQADDYIPLIVGYHQGAAVRLGDISKVTDSVQDLRNDGLANGDPAVMLLLFRQPGANIIGTVDRVRALLPHLRATLPASVALNVYLDRTPTIRASLRDVERALVVSVALVVLSVFLFLRSARAALVPLVAVPVSLIGTFGVMYLAGFSLDNLSLMALTIATGFVVDDAVVVLENVSRYLEAGVPRLQAALRGAREVGFTVVSMSLSLIAVFIPILLMGGIVGRLFREFAITLSAAILVSLVVSLTTTPMMCSRLADEGGSSRPQGRFNRLSERVFNAVHAGYRRSLRRALEHGPTVMAILAATIALNVVLYIRVPRGFFPQQDTGLVMGHIQADQAISFQAMREKLRYFVDVVKHDPAVQSVVGFTGGGQRSGGFMFISLKPRAVRGMSADAVIARLRGKLAGEPGANLYLQPAQDIRTGGRPGGAQYQYTLQADTITDLRAWEPRVRRMMSSLPELADVNTDAQDKGLETNLVIDHDAVARLGLNQSQIDSTLNDLFGQRQVSTIYHPLNQYHVVMEASPEFWQSPQTLRDVYVSSTSGAGVSASAGANPTVTTAGSAPGSGAASTGATSTGTASSVATSAGPASAGGASAGAAPTGATSAGATSTGATSAGATGKPPGQRVPLSDFSRFEPGGTPLAVTHQGLSAASTISFNLPMGVSLSEATRAISEGFARLGAPITVRGSFQGTAKAFQDALSNQPLLILSALVAVYLVLGILYESLVHPLTILSTLPSAGVGALLTLLATRTDFTIIALIGVILLIGIVKKNAIMMIDFALQIERERNLSSREAIYEACLLRLRPILMTTMAAMFGALPLAIGNGDGAELRRPLGIAVVGGLVLSQLLTLYTTPVVYLYLDRFRVWAKRRLRSFSNPRSAAPGPPPPREPGTPGPGTYPAAQGAS